MHRRQFLRRAGSFSLGFMGLRNALRAGHRRIPDSGAAGYGPLIADPRGLLDLPHGFSYVRFSLRGTPMGQHLRVPGNHDGMAAFPGPDGCVILVRNHEVAFEKASGPFGPNNEFLGLLPRHRFYDYGGGTPPLGGTTTVVYDPRTKHVVREFLSLAGTLVNCSGGPTPWGSWLSCEETSLLSEGGLRRAHGYVFEVPALLESATVAPQPLTAMGRFVHEAAAVDPRTGVVYMTEDRSDSLLYRFLPNIPGRLSAGGKLQALMVVGQPALDMSNHNAAQQIPVGTVFEVVWVDLEDVDSRRDDLRLRGAAKGAAVFSRGEGMWWGRGELFFSSTDAGLAKMGQVWRLVPGPNPLADATPAGDVGQLQLFLEPNDFSVLHNCDSLTVSPMGDLLVCEDGEIANRIVGVTPEGKTYPLALNAANTSELAGATFSPDGSILFVNELNPGSTYAITGPW